MYFHPHTSHVCNLKAAVKHLQNTFHQWKNVAGRLRWLHLFFRAYPGRVLGAHASNCFSYINPYPQQHTLAPQLHRCLFAKDTDTQQLQWENSPCPKGKCGRCYWNVVFLLTCNQTRYQGSTDGEAEGSDAHCDLVANAESKTSVSPLTVAGSNVQPVDVSAPSGPCARTSCQNLTSQSLFSTLHAAAVGCFKRAEQKPTTRLCCTVIHSCVSWENQITSSMIQHGLDLIHEILWRTTLHWALCGVFPQAYFQLGVQTGVSPCLYVKDCGIKFIFFSLPCCNSIQSFPKTPGKEAFSQPSSPLYTALKIKDQI